MKYLNAPPEIMQVISLFHENNLSYNLFKCEHIFAGMNKNLDILFANRKDYDKAALLLEGAGFVLYLPEKVEKYKEMYVRFDHGQLTRIHLHREIAWHGLKVMDKKHIFAGAKEKSKGIFVPSDEDQLLIHVAHVIFENWEISDYIKKLMVGLMQKDLDWDYIRRRLQEYGWKGVFYYVLKCAKKDRHTRRGTFLQCFVQRALRSPVSWPTLSKKFIDIILRKISLRRKGCLIALIGVNGSGKTTLAGEVLKSYHPLTKHFGGQTGYYFGWYPFSFISKLISSLLRKSNRRLFEEMNKDKEGQEMDSTRKQKFSVFHESVLFYNYFEYMLRFFLQIYPKLRAGGLVVTDRYFYDVYGQYNYSQKSIIIGTLLRFFPRPDFVYVLDAPLGVISGRAKEPNVLEKKGG